MFVFLVLSVHSFFYVFILIWYRLKTDIMVDDSNMCFFDMDSSTEGTNSSNKLCLKFVYVCFSFVLCLRGDWFCGLA